MESGEDQFQRHEPLETAITDRSPDPLNDIPRRRAEWFAHDTKREDEVMPWAGHNATDPSRSPKLSRTRPLHPNQHDNPSFFDDARRCRKPLLPLNGHFSCAGFFELHRERNLGPFRNGRQHFGFASC